MGQGTVATHQSTLVAGSPALEGANASQSVANDVDSFGQAPLALAGGNRRCLGGSHTGSDDNSDGGYGKEMSPGFQKIVEGLVNALQISLNNNSQAEPEVPLVEDNTCPRSKQAGMQRLTPLLNELNALVRTTTDQVKCSAQAANLENGQLSVESIERRSSSPKPSSSWNVRTPLAGNSCASRGSGNISRASALAQNRVQSPSADAQLAIGGSAICGRSSSAQGVPAFRQESPLRLKQPQAASAHPIDEVCASVGSVIQPPSRMSSAQVAHPESFGSGHFASSQRSAMGSVSGQFVGSQAQPTQAIGQPLWPGMHGAPIMLPRQL